AIDGRSLDIEAAVARLGDLADADRLGPSTMALIRAAEGRDIPASPLDPEDGRLLQLGQGARQRRTLAAETDRISVIARHVTQDKELTRSLLQAAGIPVPDGRPVASAEDA